jgi:GDP/UDP-N,N'-diacetylbacillosamine 2-epimerase (hydrolysing)
MKIIKLCCVTSSRSEYDLLRNILTLLEKEKSIDLYILVTGSHLKEEFGSTIRYIQKDNFKNLIEIDILDDGDDRVAMTNSIATGLKLFTKFFTNNIDWVMVLGDRFEIFSATLSARILNIPIVHFSGGDTSEGSLDNEFRHSISIMSNLHFVKLEEHKKILINLGINKQDIFKIGSLSIENYNNFQKFSLEDINKDFKVSITHPFVVISFHPVTNPTAMYDNDIELFLESLFSYEGLFLVFTSSSSDFGGKRFNLIIKDWVKKNSERSVYVESFGKNAYFSLLSMAKFMIGNSSSGLLESANFKIPAINVLPRQKGRLHNDNIINISNNSIEIYDAIDLANSEKFIKICNKVDNIFDAKLEENLSSYVTKKILSHMETTY